MKAVHRRWCGTAPPHHRRDFRRGGTATPHPTYLYQ